MDQIAKIVKEGYVAELDGKFFGIQYADGQSTSYGFGPIEKAHFSENTDLGPVGITWKGSPYVEELKKATFVHVRKTETYEIQTAPIVIPPSVKEKLKHVMSLRIPLPGCRYDPKWNLEVRDLLKYMVMNKIEILPVGTLVGNTDWFRKEEQVSLEYFIRAWLRDYSSPYRLREAAQATQELVNALVDTGVFMTVNAITARFEGGVLPEGVVPQRIYDRPVLCLKIDDDLIKEDLPMNDTPNAVDLEEPEDALSLDEQLHLESQHEDNESIRATEAAEERMRGED